MGATCGRTGEGHASRQRANNGQATQRSMDGLCRTCGLLARGAGTGELPRFHYRAPAKSVDFMGKEKQLGTGAPCGRASEGDASRQRANNGLRPSVAWAAFAGHAAC